MCSIYFLSILNVFELSQELYHSECGMLFYLGCVCLYIKNHSLLFRPNMLCLICVTLCRFNLIPLLIYKYSYIRIQYTYCDLCASRDEFGFGLNMFAYVFHFHIRKMSECYKMHKYIYIHTYILVHIKYICIVYINIELMTITYCAHV